MIDISSQNKDNDLPAIGHDADSRDVRKDRVDSYGERVLQVIYDTIYGKKCDIGSKICSYIVFLDSGWKQKDSNEC